jgi:hypothetical protein
MRGRNTRADGSTLHPLLQWFSKAIQGKVGQLSAAVIKDGPIWRFPSVKRSRTRMLIIGGYGLTPDAAFKLVFSPFHNLIHCDSSMLK